VAQEALAIESTAILIQQEPLVIEATPVHQKKPKCERCWHHHDQIGENTQHATLCPRCITNLEGSGELRLYA
jgi:isoleucyl-tRNA synthetase